MERCTATDVHYGGARGYIALKFRGRRGVWVAGRLTILVLGRGGLRGRGGDETSIQAPARNTHSRRGTGLGCGEYISKMLISHPLMQGIPSDAGTRLSNAGHAFRCGECVLKCRYIYISIQGYRSTDGLAPHGR